MYVCTHVCMYAGMYVCMYVRMYVFMYVCMHVHVCYMHCSSKLVSAAQRRLWLVAEASPDTECRNDAVVDAQHGGSCRYVRIEGRARRICNTAWLRRKCADQIIGYHSVSTAFGIRMLFGPGCNQTSSQQPRGHQNSETPEPEKM